MYVYDFSIKFSSYKKQGIIKRSKAIHQTQCNFIKMVRQEKIIVDRKKNKSDKATQNLSLSTIDDLEI